MTFQGTTKIEAATGTAFPKKNKQKAINWGSAVAALRAVTPLAKSPAVKVAVTPDIAAQWLAMNKNNRPLGRTQAAGYARDMAAGNWRDEGGDPIQIGANGRLLNGQHRLSAVVECGSPVDMFVIFGADPSAVMAIDRGRSRSHRDTFVLSTGETVSSLFFPIAMAAMFGVESKATRPTSQEMETFISVHRKALDFADGLMVDTRRGVRRGGVGAVLARAYYHLPQDKIENFAGVLATGTATSKTPRIVMTLRDWLTGGVGRGVHGSTGRYVVYRKTARALTAFANGELIRTLYEISTEPFPLPGKKSRK